MRFYVIESKAIIFVGLMFSVMALLTINVSGSPLASVFFYASNRKIPIYCVDRDDKQIALSFDAAWGSDKTESILGVLDKFNIKATFFVTGEAATRNPDLLVRPALNGAPSANFMSGGWGSASHTPCWSFTIAWLSSLDASTPLLFLKAF